MVEKINPTGAKILRLLYHNKIPMTAYLVGKLIHISYPTAKKYLEYFVSKGAVTILHPVLGNTKQYTFNHEILKDVPKKKRLREKL